MTLDTVSTEKSHGGVQGIYKHASRATGTEMIFSVFVPPHAEGAKLPIIWYLSGLTCTHANVTDKGEFRRTCTELGLIFVAPDTSPRGEGVPDDPDGAYDFGLGAGFVHPTRTVFLLLQLLVEVGLLGGEGEVLGNRLVVEFTLLAVNAMLEGAELLILVVYGFILGGFLFKIQ